MPFIASRLSGLTQCPADPLKISFVCGNSCCYAPATASLAMRIIQVKIFHRLWKQHPVCNALCAPVCVCVIKWSVRNTHTLALLKLELYANTDTHSHAHMKVANPNKEYNSMRILFPPTFISFDSQIKMRNKFASIVIKHVNNCAC